MTDKPSKNKPKAGDAYQIPVEGSLGLLALGYRGILEWRKVREAAKKNQEQKEAGEGNDK